MVGAAVVEVGAVFFVVVCPDPPLLHAASTTATHKASTRSSVRGRGKRVDAATDVPIGPSPEVRPTISMF